MNFDKSKDTDVMVRLRPGSNGPLPFQVSGRIMYCSRQLWGALCGAKPALPMDWESDGCSGGAPDSIGRYKLWPACVIHDYHYRNDVLGARNAIGRLVADTFLRENIRELVRLQGGSRFKAWRIAWLYYGRVRIWGKDSWQNWDDGAAPASVWQRVREAYGLT